MKKKVVVGMEVIRTNGLKLSPLMIDAPW